MRLKREQKIEVCGETIMLEEVKIFREFVAKENKFEVKTKTGSSLAQLLLPGFECGGDGRLSDHRGCDHQLFSPSFVLLLLPSLLLL